MITLQPWHDFFLLTGTAAATLLGLVFVAGSIAAAIPNEKLGDDPARALWILPIVYAFVRVFVVSAVGVVPGETGRTFGWVVSALSTFDLSRMVWVFTGMSRQHRTRERVSRADWTWYVAYPMVATVLVACTG